MIPVLSLIITILVAFIGPLVAWAVARQQIDVAAREAWLREFRGQIATFLASGIRFRRHMHTHTTGDREKEQRLAEISDAIFTAYYVLKLLVAEKGEGWVVIGKTLDKVVETGNSETQCQALLLEAETILSTERENIAADRGVWHALKAALWSNPRPGRVPTLPAG